MMTITERYMKEKVVEKSRFIAVLCPLRHVEDAPSIIMGLRKEFPKATHHCSAYVHDGYSRCNDDGEPSGTAGRPMLEVLLRQRMNRVLLVVVRYYGGVKLGAGRLLSTYVEAAVSVIDACEKYQIELAGIYKVQLDYARENVLIVNQKDLEYSILAKDYQEDKVVFRLESRTDLLESLTQLFEGKVMVEFLGREERLLKVGR